MFKKILLSNIAILTVTFLITGAFLFGIMRNYFIEERQAEFDSAISQIRDITAYALSLEGSGATIMLNLDMFAKNLASAVFVIDTNGRVVFSSRLNNSPSVGLTLAREQYEELLSGGNIRRVAPLPGVSSDNVFIYASPLSIGGKIAGGIFICTPLGGVGRFFGNAFLIFIISALISLLIGLIITFIISRLIARPVIKIKKAVDRMTDGDFNTKIEITSHDELRGLSRAFNEMTESLNQTELRRREFVANVSHELRTPMTTIMGFIEGILDGTIPYDEQSKYLNITLNETKRLTRLVNDLLYIERYRENEAALAKTDYDINEQIKIVLIGFEKAIYDNEIEVNLTFCDDATVVTADYDSIQRVISNLIDNAVKFSPRGGALNIEVSQDDGIYVAINNQGVIEQEDQKLLFERFYKADKSRGIDGAGLGLYIVKDIINAHNQTITFTSDVETGTTFKFSLDKD